MNNFLSGEHSIRAIRVRRGGAALAVAGLVTVGSLVVGSNTQAASTPNPDLAESCAPLDIVVAVDASSAVTSTAGPSAADLAAAVSAVGQAAKTAGANIRLVSYTDAAAPVTIGGSSEFAPADPAAISAWATAHSNEVAAAAAPAPAWNAAAANIANAPGDLVIWLAAGPATDATDAGATLDGVRKAGSHVVGVAVGPAFADAANLDALGNAVDTADRTTWNVADGGAPSVVTTDVVVTPGAGASGALTTLLKTLPAVKCGLSLTKDSATVTDTDKNKVGSVGDVVNYSFTVSNTGSVDLTNVKITTTDGVTVDGCAAKLAPGAKQTCAAKYTVTAADVKAGTVADVATAQATGLNSPVTSSKTDLKVALTAATTTKPAAVPAAAPDVQVIKSASLAIDVDKDGLVDLGDTIAYTFSITNKTGKAIEQVTLADFGPNNTSLAAELTGKPIATLANGATDDKTYSAKHVVTQADVDAGMIEDQATVSYAGSLPKILSDAGTDSALKPVSNPFTTETQSGAGLIPNNAKDTADDPTAVTVNQVAKVELAVEATIADTNSSGKTDAGDVVTYKYTVDNGGNVTLTKVTVTDTLVTNLDCTITDLKVEDNKLCQGTHTLTAAEAALTTLQSTAKAAATTASGTKVPDATIETSVALGASKTLSIGDRAWYDTNRDGIQNNSEPGLTGVTVTLNGAGMAQLSTKTDNLGRYRFDSLAEGTYTVTFVAPTGYTFTTSDAGGDRSLDSNASATGTATVVLSATVVPDSDVAGLELTNSTVDAGFVVATYGNSTTTTYRYNTTTTYRYGSGSGNTYTGGNASRVGGFALVVFGFGMVARLVARRRQPA